MVGPLGQTGRLGLARPGSAAGEPGDGVVSERGSLAPWFRARRLQATSAERVTAGPLQEAGFECLSIGEFGALDLFPQQTPAGSYIRARKSWTLVRERISQEGSRERAQGLLGYRGTSRDPGRPPPAASRPPEAHLSWIRDGPCRGRFFLVLSPLRGEGGRARGLRGTGRTRPESLPREGYSRRTPDAGSRLPLHTSGMVEVCPLPGREFHRGEGGDSPGPPGPPTL